MNKIKNMKKSTRQTLLTLAMIIAFYIVIEVMIMTGNATRHLKSMLVPMCYNAIAAVSLNLVIGFLGELSLGQAAFMSLGAYSSCLFSIRMRRILPAAVRFPLAVLLGGVVAAVFGIVIGVPVLRLSGDYLAIVTLAFGEILRSVFINLDITGGAAGLKKMPQDSSFTYGIIVLIVAVIVISNTIDSKAGRAIMAVRDNTIAASSVGININFYKVLVFVMAAFFGGCAGALFGHNYSIITPGQFDYNKSIEILLMVVFGGMGSVRGSIIARVVITFLPEAMRGFADYRMIVYAVALIMLMLFGNNPKINRFKAKLFNRRNRDDNVRLTQAQKEVK